MKLYNKIQIGPSPTIREEVYKLLREGILTGKIGSGERLIESRLAEDLNTSRTPVREALHKLEMENLVKSISRIGHVVREINQEEVDEICQLRLNLETLAAKWASEKITPKELKRLKTILLLTERYIKKNNGQKVIELDTEFHDIICKASRSQRLEEMSQNLRDHMLRFRIKGLCIPEIAARSNEGHWRIYRALKEGNMKDIESAVSFHLNRTRKDLEKVIRGIK